MKLAESLEPGLVIPNLTAQNKVDCIMECAEAIANAHTEFKKDDIAFVLLEREKLGSTGIQDGVAIPHGKFNGLSNTLVLFARSIQGVDFQAFDNHPTHLFFVLLAPQSGTSEHLKLLARLSRLLKNELLRVKLLQAKDSKTLYKMICEEDEKLA